MKRELSERIKTVKETVKSWAAGENFWFFPKPVVVFVKRDRRKK